MTINPSPRNHKKQCHLIIRHQTHIKIKTCLSKSQVFFQMLFRKRGKVKSKGYKNKIPSREGLGHSRQPKESKLGNREIV